MTNSQRLATVRARLLRWLADHRDSGTDDASVPQLAESILIRDGFFCGRRFDAGTHQAVWFMEEDELKIFGDSGELVCSMPGIEISEQASATTVLSVTESTDSTDDVENATHPDVIKLPTVSRDESDDEQIRRAA